MDKQTMITLARCANMAYTRNVNYGKGLEVHISTQYLGGEVAMVLAFTGSNDGFDWLRNFDIRKKHGLKRSSLMSAERMKGLLWDVMDEDMGLPLYVTGHSLGASRAIAYADRFEVAGGAFFNPPPTIAKGRLANLKNCVLFRDPDDPVDQAGNTWFDHPVCPTISRRDDHIGHRVSEHFMEKWIPFIEENF